MMHQVLVTGGAGFIGSNFIHFLLNKEPHVRVINLDALTYAGNLENLKELPDEERYHFIKGDITDRTLLKTIFADFKIDTVVHFAAESHVDRSITGPMPFVETNVIGTTCLLEAARTSWLVEKKVVPAQTRFHHVSTDEVFGALSPGDPPFSETTPYAPNSPYAASKAASDHLVRAYFHTYQLPVTITNCSNNYGPFQFPEKLIPLVILNAVQGKPLPVYGDGKQIRDWLYVADHCAAIWTVLKKGVAGQTYNIGGNNQPTNLEIIQTICAILDESLPGSSVTPYSKLIEFVPDRPGHDRRYAMDTRKIEHELGWKPTEDLKSGLHKTVTWYLDHTDWVKSIDLLPGYQSWIQQNYAKRGGVR
jgi:dTDP-glucose 4,6-dehydratase